MRSKFVIAAIAAAALCWGAGKRIYQFPHSKTWSGYLLQDADGDSTRAVSKSVVESTLVNDGFLSGVSVSDTAASLRGSIADTSAALRASLADSTTAARASAASALVDTASALRGSLVDTASALRAAIGGGGSGASTTEYTSTMPPASAITKLAAPGGTSTNWAYHGTLFVPASDVTLTAGASRLAMQWPQPTQGASYFFAVYRWVASGTSMPLVCSTAIATMPGANSWLDLPVSTVRESLTGGDQYYFCVFWTGNGGMAMGVSGDNLNVQPYQAIWDMNQGTLTGAPATLTITGEDYRRFFGCVRAN